MQNKKQNVNQFLVYLLIILITLNISFFIFKGSSNATFVENFNFASTITSIILSVIAIIYTFIDSSQSKSISNNIISSAEEIKKTSEDLKNIKADIQLSIENMHREINRTILNETCIIRESIERKNNTTNALNISNVDDLSLMIEGLRYSTRNYLLILYLSFEYNISFITYEYIDFYNRRLYNSNLSRAEQKSMHYEFLLILEILGCLNLIDYYFYDCQIYIKDFNDNFKQTLSSEFDNLIPKDDISSELIIFKTTFEFFNTKNNK